MRTCEDSRPVRVISLIRGGQLESVISEVPISVRVFPKQVMCPKRVMFHTRDI